MLSDEKIHETVEKYGRDKVLAIYEQDNLIGQNYIDNICRFVYDEKIPIQDVLSEFRIMHDNGIKIDYLDRMFFYEFQDELKYALERNKPIIKWKENKKDNDMKYFWNFIVLALIGGCIGLQEFYLKRNALGIFAVLFCWTFVPCVVSLIEAIVWLFRGEEEFKKKYGNTY